jgi:hypothetical protein
VVRSVLDPVVDEAQPASVRLDELFPNAKKRHFESFADAIRGLKTQRFIPRDMETSVRCGELTL